MDEVLCVFCLKTQRSRKCSIVREEEDDEEGAVAAPTARSSDARRGSRSEGRLHLARPAQLADNLTKVSACNELAYQ